jgi:hypothetical protein
LPLLCLIRPAQRAPGRGRQTRQISTAHSSRRPEASSRSHSRSALRFQQPGVTSMDRRCASPGLRPGPRESRDLSSPRSTVPLISYGKAVGRPWTPTRGEPRTPSFRDDHHQDDDDPAGIWRPRIQTCTWVGSRSAIVRVAPVSSRPSVTAPMRAQVVKRACWIDPVTCWLAAGWVGTVVGAFPRRCWFVPSCRSGVMLERPQRRAGRRGRGRGRTSLRRQAAADHRERGIASCGVGVCGGRWLVSPARVVVGVGLTRTHSAPAWWRVAMTVTPGTGLLSQDSERGQAGSCGHASSPAAGGPPG